MKFLHIISKTAVLLLFLSSCSSGISKPNKKIEGEYVFKYPSGQIEILSMKFQPNIYYQSIYSNERDYLNKATPIFKNSNTWSSSGSDLTFKNWFSICYLASNPDSILLTPYFVELNNVNWYQETKTKNAEIDIFSENEYIFIKK